MSVGGELRYAHFVSHGFTNRYGDRFGILTARTPRAGVAQLVEHLLPKQNVAGSSPVSRSHFVHTLEIEFSSLSLYRLDASILMTKWKIRAHALKSSAMAVYVAVRDPRTPWYVRVLAVCVATYALSPIDLIPDFIPVIGYFDDLIIIPLGIALVVRLLPAGVWTDAQKRSVEMDAGSGPPKWIGGAIIVMIWIVSVASATWFAWRWIS